jgi:hypothetical protein
MFLSRQLLPPLPDLPPENQSSINVRLEIKKGGLFHWPEKYSTKYDHIAHLTTDRLLLRPSSACWTNLRNGITIGARSDLDVAILGVFKEVV